jgi:hypothetical protein
VIARFLLAMSLVVAAAMPARAQDARLEGRLDPDTRAAVEAIIDSAEAAGLPTDPLVLKALEGASKRAPGSRIVAAVRSLDAELREARTALGPSSLPAELTAAAAALHAGATPAELARLRATRTNEPLTVPLAVLADLIARGVPADTASSIIHGLAVRGARDDGFFALRTSVERDIMAGAAPTGAAAARAKEIGIGVRGAPPVKPPEP